MIKVNLIVFFLGSVAILVADAIYLGDVVVKVINYLKDTSFGKLDCTTLEKFTHKLIKCLKIVEPDQHLKEIEELLNEFIKENLSIDPSIDNIRTSDEFHKVISELGRITMYVTLS